MFIQSSAQALGFDRSVETATALEPQRGFASGSGELLAHRRRHQAADDPRQQRAAAERDENRDDASGDDEAAEDVGPIRRQRRALREFGKDPDQAKARPASVVEKYEQ